MVVSLHHSDILLVYCTRQVLQVEVQISCVRSCATEWTSQVHFQKMPSALSFVRIQAHTPNPPPLGPNFWEGGGFQATTLAVKWHIGPNFLPKIGRGL